MIRHYSTIILKPLLVMLAFLYEPQVHAQQFQLKAGTDTSEILIGEPLEILLELKYKSGQQWIWPPVPDTLNHFEVVSRSDVDSAYTDAWITRTQKITLTTFEPGTLYVPPFQFHRLTGDTATTLITTDSQRIVVNLMSVDTASSIREIKAPLKVPYTFREMLPYILAVLGGIALIILLYFLIRRVYKKKDAVPPPQPTRPPHAIALEKLDWLEKEKLWQNGNVKEYHDRLTDIVREYLELRFNIPAMESTTEEILHELKTTPASNEAKDQLREIFELADLAKFARAQPAVDENERSMKVALNFIHTTKLQDESKEEGGAS